MLRPHSDPFPHLVLYNRWEPELLRHCRAEFDDVDWTPGWRNANEFKDGAPFEAGYWCMSMQDRLTDPAWIAEIEDAFGIPNLSFDPEGGGLHRIPLGGFLNVHFDFNRSSRTGLYRRINCLVYLNEDWQPGDGGELQLHRNPAEPPAVLVRPQFNTTVLFATSETSWHGHPSPIARGQRCSLAGYYFSPEPAPSFTETHSTVFA